MASNKSFQFGPIALTATYTTNLLNPATLTGGVNGGSGACFILLKHLKIVNKTAAPATFRLYRGATIANAAGTELAYDVTVPAYDYKDLWGAWRFDSTDFLVGGASAGTTLTISGEGEIGVA